MKRKGYAKIVGACERAIEDGWNYIWIGTCCINKESSAELSEAINSMHKWYQKSEVYYVYLEDVHSSGHIAEDIEKDGRVEAKLTSLLVPQIDTPTANDVFPKTSRITIKTLPTESGFTIEDHSLVKGYDVKLFRMIRYKVSIKDLTRF